MAIPNLEHFAKLINDRAETFARPSADNPISAPALQLIAYLFNAALKEEEQTIPLYSNLLDELSEHKPTTRAQAAALKKKRKEKNPNLDHTALDSLHVPKSAATAANEGDDENLWMQLDLKYGKLTGLARQVMGSNEYGDLPDEEEGQASEGSEEEANEDQDPMQMDGDSDSEDQIIDGEEGSQSESEADSQVGQESFQALTEAVSPKSDRRTLSLSNFDEPSASTSKTPAQGPMRKGKRSAVDDDFFSLDDFHAQSDRGEFKMAKLLAKAKSKNPEEEDESSDEESVDLFSNLLGTGDSMMDLDELEMADEDNDLQDVADVTYSEFFDPPSRLPPKKKSKSSPPPSTKKSQISKAIEDTLADESTVSNRSVRFNDQVRVKSIAARKNAGMDVGNDSDDSDEGEFDLDLNDDGMKEEGDGSDLEEDEDGEGLDLEDLQQSDLEDEDDEEIEGDANELDEEVDDYEGDAIERFKNDLFEDEEESDPDEEALSRHQKRMKTLSEQIAQMEQENIGKKDWTLGGEARGRDRPQNSLLEEDLEFEHMAKSAPIITAERSLSLEDKIKARIIEERFDDVEKRLPFDPAAFLPSRLLDISGKQSDVGLAQLYEDEYSEERQRAEGREVVDVRDAKLEKEHKEIEELFEIVCGKLDALSNAHFTPKAPQTTIQSTSNLSAVSMEDALPTTSTTSTLLAPEEVYSADKNNIDKSDMTPAGKRALRQKGRQARKRNAEKVDKLSGAAAREKEKARQKLVGNKGVTVIGKDGKKQKPVKGKSAEKGSRPDSSNQNAIKLKL